MKSENTQKVINDLEKFVEKIKEGVLQGKNITFLVAGIIEKIEDNYGVSSIWQSYSIGDKKYGIDSNILETLQIAFHPVRVKILEFCLKPRKQIEIEGSIGLKGGGLYHHLRLLEFSRLLEKGEDKLYRTTKYGTFVLVVARRACGIFKKETESVTQ